MFYYFQLSKIFFADTLFSLKFTARSGLCSLIYQIFPRAKQLDLSVTISRYIGLAPFSYRSLTLEWFRVSFFGLSFRLILYWSVPILESSLVGFPFSDPVPVIDTCLFSGFILLWEPSFLNLPVYRNIKAALRSDVLDPASLARLYNTTSAKGCQ